MVPSFTDTIISILGKNKLNLMSVEIKNSLSTSEIIDLGFAWHLAELL